MQWWTFIRIAHRLPFRPSMTQHSHSGRSRFRRRSSTSATTRNSSVSSPGRGTAIRRTWRLMSNAGSSTHCGAPTSKGWVRSICVHRGIDLIRSARTALNFSYLGAAPSMMAIPPIAKLTLRSESSAMRKPASRVLSCSTPHHRRSFAGLDSSIGGDHWSEVAAILIRVNNWSRLCGNAVGKRAAVLVASRAAPLFSQPLRFSEILQSHTKVVLVQNISVIRLALFRRKCFAI